MTKEEAEKYLYWFNNDYKDRKAVTAHFKSTSLAMDGEQHYWDKANEAKKVLGIHQWQRTFEQLKTVHPLLTHEQYLNYRIKHGIDKQKKYSNN